MTHNEILTLLQETGVPVAYDHFSEGESPDPPFLCFLYPESNNLSADGRVYAKIDALHVELYTDKKDPEAEAQVETALDAQELFYNKSEVWIPEERLYEVLYTTSVLKTEDETEDGGTENESNEEQG
jgi:hypothetical protein